jgi:hypothetical protein
MRGEGGADYDRGRSPDRRSPDDSDRRRRERSPPRRVALYDRVWCNLGQTMGWCSGNVQAVDQQQENVTLAYVVMLDPPHKRLISVPSDRNGCVRADVCFEAWPEGPPPEAQGQPCVQATSCNVPVVRPKLRFATDDRVACLTAGPDGLDWPRRWSAGTVMEVWHTQAGAASPVPYTVLLDTPHPQQRPMTVLVHRDEHKYIRALAFQPAGECPSGVTLPRFTVLRSEEEYVEKVDQQTLRKRKSALPPSGCA